MKKDTSVNVRLTSELKAELQQFADEEARKLSAYIELVLRAHVAAKREKRASYAPAHGRKR